MYSLQYILPIVMSDEKGRTIFSWLAETRKVGKMQKAVNIIVALGDGSRDIRCTGLSLPLGTVSVTPFLLTVMVFLLQQMTPYWCW